MSETSKGTYRRERLEAQERYRMDRRKVGAVVRYLPGWSLLPPAKDNERWIEIGRRELRIVFCRCDYPRSEAGRFHVYGTWPRGEGNGYHRPRQEPQIRVSKSRPAAHIARELQRRLLPQYEAAWVECKARAEAEVVASHERALVVDMLCNLDGRPGYSGGQDQAVFGEAGSFSWKAEVGRMNAKEVDLHLRRLPALLARQIVCTLQQWASSRADAGEEGPCKSS